MRDNVAVCDHPGRKTAVLADRVMSSGHHAVVWDGRDNAEKQAGAGIYMFMVRAGSLTKIGKMTLIHDVMPNVIMSTGNTDETNHCRLKSMLNNRHQ